ncbi:hypothetical protein SALBM311S_09285 [Streptomyces alboniger]
MIYIKQAQTPAVSRHITDPATRDYFQHGGPRTVIPQRALQAPAAPGRGWPEVGGGRQLVAEVPPYAVDLEGGDIDAAEKAAAVAADGGRATATNAAAADDHAESPGRRSPASAPATRRAPPAGRASRTSWSTSPTHTAHARVPTTRPSWTCSATAGFRVCDDPLSVGPLTGIL